MGSVSRFEHVYSRFAEAGGNFNRLFLTHGNLNIMERVVATSRPDKGMGRLNLEYCWCVDQILRMGKQLGIYHMLTLTNQTNFRTGNGGWDVNVYNVKNGGFLKKPGEYFTDQRAQRVFEHLLRYAVARWGASTSVFSWDLWNEVSAAEGFQPATAARWHQRMARYLRSVDPTKHVIHTNFGHLNSFAEIDGLPEMELVSTNIYAVKDIAHISEVWTKRLIERFGKPYMLTEYGIGHNMGAAGYAPHDPERVMVHNGLWSPLLSGSAGTGMAWDWNWLDDDHFYRYIRAVARAVKSIPFSRRTWRDVQVQAFEFAHYVRRNGPNLEVRGMQTDDYILIWLKHPEFNWIYRRMGMTSDAQPAGRLTLGNVPDGTWSAQWIDTIKARIIRHESMTAKNSILRLTTLPTARSLVVRLQKN